MHVKSKVFVALALAGFFAVAMLGFGTASAALITVSSTSGACPVAVPYCPYGSYTITDNNGCSEKVCNSSLSQSSYLNFFKISPSSVAPGQPVTITFSGINLLEAAMTLTCPAGVTAPDGHGEDGCGQHEFDPLLAGVNTAQFQFNNTTGNSQQVLVTLKGYDMSDMPVVPTDSGYITVTSAPTSNSPTISYLNPTSVAAGGAVTIYGSDLYGDGVLFDGNSIIPSSQDPSGDSMVFMVPSSARIGSHTVQINPKITGTLSNSVTLNVIAGTSPILPPSPVPSPIPVTTTVASNVSTQALQQQLTQLITLLLQLLQQAAAQGLLSSSQLSAALGAVSH